jgi:hypothetical protein
MASPFEIILTIIVLSFWFVFPLGMFLSVSHVDKNTDQIVRLGAHRHFPDSAADRPSRDKKTQKFEVKSQSKVHVAFRRWVRH